MSTSQELAEPARSDVRAARERREASPARGRLEIVLGLAALAFLAWILACLVNSAQFRAADDAFITYVYGRNLAEGHGLRYNPTDAEPTSGASSLLHVLFAAAAWRAGADPLVATRALGVAALLAVAVATGLAAARATRCGAGAGLLAGAAVVLAIALLPETTVHLSSGMETLLFFSLHALAAAWAVGVAARERPPSVAAGLAGALIGVALLLSRPEGGLLAAGWLAAAAFARSALWPGRGAGRELRALAPAWVALGLAAVGLAVWHAAYFGHLLPNPYYVKSANRIFGSSGEALPGLDTTWRFALMRFLPLAGLAALLARWAGAGRRALAPAAWLALPSAVVLALYARAVHEMAGGYRYEWPLLAPLFAGAAVALGALRRRSKASFAGALAAGGIAVPLLYSPLPPPILNWLSHPRSAATVWLEGRNQGNALERLGLDLAETGLGQRATILLSGAGQVPWHSRFRAIDWIGLNDNVLSGRAALSIEEVWRYIEDQKPDVVYSILPPAAPGSSSPEEDPNFQGASVQRTLAGRGSALFSHWNPERFAEMVWREMTFIRDRCELGAAYELGGAWGDAWWLYAYVRNDSPHREVLMGTLRGSKRADR
jgi:arabinofuranosyltransferase